MGSHPHHGVPPEWRQDRARERFLHVVRQVHDLEARRLARPFRLGGGRMLHGFREVLILCEEGRGAARRLADLMVTFDPEIDMRLRTLARTIAEHDSRSVGELIASRGFRRIHTAALGAGALMMWSFGGPDAARHWRHGIATGILAHLALKAQPVQRDRLFAVGLLHDLGRYAINETLPPVNATVGRARHRAFVADVAGRLVAAELHLPAWLRDAIHPCELGATGGDRVARTVGAACVVASQLGYPRSGASRYAPRLGEMRDVRRALDAQGGPEWLETRIRSMSVAANGDLSAVLTAA